MVERRQACALQKGARRIARCGGGYPAFAGVPLPSIFFVARVEQSETRGRRGNRKLFPDFAALNPGYETGRTEDRKRPHPCPFLGPDRFRPGHDHNFASARCSRSRAGKTRAPIRAARTGALAMKLCRRWRKKVRRATNFTASCRECARSIRAPGAEFPRHGPRAPGSPAGRRRAPTARARRRRPLSGRACQGGTGGAPG